MILGIESSCDESALAVFSQERGIEYECIQSQMALHEKYGGVVPALATRQHLKTFGPIISELQEKLPNWKEKINTVAVTYGPGLAGCLALGVSTAKALSLHLNVPLVGINHLRAHALSSFISLHARSPESFPDRFHNLLPHLGLIASGGNTLLFKLDTDLNISIIAETVDDACGEALDKGAKLLGMPYPGGALIEKTGKQGDPHTYDFPIAFASKNEMKFSFSGLKTSLRYLLEKMDDSELNLHLPNICASYQAAVTEALKRKTTTALENNAFKSLGLSGGVANNQTLRQKLQDLSNKFGIDLLLPEARHTGDNAAMIAFCSWIDSKRNIQANSHNISITPNLRLTAS